MIANVIIIVAVLMFSVASAQVMYKSYLETNLDYIDELVKRGADINLLIKKGRIR